MRAEVYVKYLDPNSSNWTAAMNSLITSIANGTAPANTFIDGGSPGSTGGVTAPHLGALNKSGESGTAPKAYLNYIIFDRDYIIKDGGFVRVTTAAREYGQDGIHERLSASITVSEPGYIYLYLSNDNVSLGGAQVEVYFDDFMVEHIKSPVVQSQDYYPFGLTYNSYSRENSLSNQWKFQGQENVDELGLNWDSFKWRNHQPEIGRFFGVDPLAEKYVYNSVYAFSENRVVNGRELEGLEWVNATGQLIYDPHADGGIGGYTEHATKNEQTMGESLRQTKQGAVQFDKLVRSKRETTVVLNNSEEVIKNKEGDFVLGTTNINFREDVDVDDNRDVDPSIRKYDAKVHKAKVTINSATIGAALDEELKSGDALFADVNVGKNVTFTDLLGAVFGHEIEHTTNNNMNLSLNDRSAAQQSAENSATKVSNAIIKELNTKKTQ